jgi:hypothetical protein
MMMSKITVSAAMRLSDAALVLLGHAASRGDGMVLPPPAALRARGGALEKVLKKLLARELVEEVPVLGEDQAWRTDDEHGLVGLRITADGLKAISVQALDSAAESASADQSDEAPAKAAASQGTPEALAGDDIHPQSVSPGTKQARLVDLLCQPCGQTIGDLASALGWQAHTVRAALTGLHRKGYTIGKAKSESGETVYSALPPSGTAADTAASQNAA